MTTKEMPADLVRAVELANAIEVESAALHAEADRLEADLMAAKRAGDAAQIERASSALLAHVAKFEAHAASAGAIARHLRARHALGAA